MRMRVNLAPLESLLILVVALVMIGAVFLAFGLKEDHPGAWMVLGALVGLGLISVGGGIVLAIMYVAHRMERNRAQVDQEQFVANAKENMALLSAMANAQNAHARTQATHQRALLDENRNLRRALPEPGTVVDVEPRITFDSQLFEELELED